MSVLKTDQPELDKPLVISGEDEKFYIASQWQLMWWKFLKHRLAVASGLFIIFMYTTALFAPFVSPYAIDNRDTLLRYAPPTDVHIRDEDGSLDWPFVYNVVQSTDPETFKIAYKEDTSQKYYLKFFVHGDPYEFLGLFKSDLHLFGVTEGAKIFLFGSEELGRDLFTRTIFASRVSLSIGLFGVFLSLILGLLFGGLAGFLGGTVDNLIQRISEILRSFPTIPLWLTLSAALPPKWPPLQVYFAILIILSFTGWTGLARVVRGKLLSLRQEDFVIAAQFSGAKTGRIIWRHMIPSFTSHIIASISMAIPGMIMGETSLSFLGLGLRPPVISWGVLLKISQNIFTISSTPWLLIPAIFVIVVVLAFNFLGDGLRDAADPYASIT
jgi:peptide/nickel transport system permease protein